MNIKHTIKSKTGFQDFRSLRKSIEAIYVCVYTLSFDTKRGTWWVLIIYTPEKLPSLTPNSC